MESPQSDGSRYDYQSDASDISNFTDDNLSSLSREKCPSGIEVNPKSDVPSILFQITNTKSSFLRKRKDNSGINSFTQGLNKITFGGLEKMTNSLDRIKEFVTQNDTSPRYKNYSGKRRDKEIDQDSENDYQSPSSNLFSPVDTIAPALQLEDFETGSLTPITSDASFLGNANMSPDETQLPAEFSYLEASLEQRNTNSYNITLNGILDFLRWIMSGIWFLHLETTKGPWKLGPINSSLYERNRLEECFFELIAEVFELSYRQNWIYTQMHYFLKPILLALGGHVVNRYILKSNVEQ
jgi:hypothetical protein